MVRRTSIAVYRRIKAEGLLSKMRFAVYRVLFYYGPMTRAEIVKHLSTPGTARQPDIYNRLSDLRKMKAADVVGTRTCSVTGNTCQLWDVTDRIPEKVERDRSQLEILEEENRLLRDEVVRLKIAMNRRKARRRPS